MNELKFLILRYLFFYFAMIGKIGQGYNLHLIEIFYFVVALPMQIGGRPVHFPSELQIR